MSFTICLKFPDCRAALNWILVTTTSTKLKKLVNGERISIRNVPTGKTGLPFQSFRLSQEFSSVTNQKNVYHLHFNRNFLEFVVNGKQPWIPDANRKRDPAFLELNFGSGTQKFPGFRDTDYLTEGINRVVALNDG